MLKNICRIGLYLVITSISIVGFSQNTPQLCTINNISNLESNKDPKCHATANRLENFMYGTPLDDEAREKKIDLQKKLILFIWNNANKNCVLDTITQEVLNPIINNTATFGKLKTGEWYFSIGEELITVHPNDLRQYSSVAYSLRAILSVEQDLLFSDSWNLKPMTFESIENIKIFIDLATLAALKLADYYARTADHKIINSSLLEQAWSKLFDKPYNKVFLNNNYPKINTSNPDDSYLTIRNIIAQKIKSYENYNEISLPILLRNIQVYFARHKWPIDAEKSDALKSYLLESLIFLSSEIITSADAYADAEAESFIRSSHINKAALQYVPISVNQFEDVTYFPNIDEAITIESYDLDAFRDSGLHWKILEYALGNLDPKAVSELDPFAAEIIVETIAQWALLVLRVTGDISIKNNNPTITLTDMEEGFQYIQTLIHKKGESKTTEKAQNDIVSSNSENPDFSEKVFVDNTSKVGIDFYHKSSDWLSRLIRSYVIKKDENLVRMAIPPAFGGSGVAAEDINNDGFIDLFLAGGMGNKLYLNNGKGYFKDITESSGIDTWNDELKSYAEIRQVIIADFDNDGLQDIFLSLVNENHKLYKNINGETFIDVSDNSSFNGLGMVAGPATAFDYDKDGLLDIYIGYFGNYLKGNLPTLDRNNQNGDTNKLFKNNGDLKFEEVEHIIGFNDQGWTQALVHVDINQDGYQDIIVGNDFGINAYYINDKNGHFKNENQSLKTDKPSYTMSIGSADLNKDLRPDLYISNIVVMEKDEKYINPSTDTKMNFDPEKMQNIRTVEANDLFISEKNNEEQYSFSLSENVGRGKSSTGWSWDADFFDFDNDGDEDLYCLNGMNDFRVYGSENPYYNSPDGESKEVIYAQSNKEKNVFFVNENGFLKEKSASLGTDLNTNSRSAAYFDLENDGDLDIILNNYHDKAVFLENNISNSKNWIKLKLIGNPEAGINLDAIGAVIILKNAAENLQIWREVHSTTGYLSVHPKTQHFGLGNAKDIDITIKWGNGETAEYHHLQPNNEYHIEFGKEPVKTTKL